MKRGMRKDTRQTVKTTQINTRKDRTHLANNYSTIACHLVSIILTMVTMNQILISLILRTQKCNSIDLNRDISGLHWCQRRIIPTVCPLHLFCFRNHVGSATFKSNQNMSPDSLCTYTEVDQKSLLWSQWSYVNDKLMRDQNLAHCFWQKNPI